MKNLQLENEKHKRIEKAFGEWLKVMGYASSTVYSLPLYAREFFHWLEQEGKELEKVTPADIENYFFHLSTRPCNNKTGTMSSNNLHKHRQGLKRLSYYLRETGQTFLEIDVLLPKQKRKEKTILTREEIKALYEACQPTPLGIRDRAMLAIFYGCGLRRSEGTALNVTDFLLNKNLIYIRCGKHYKERYTPLSFEVKNEIENYLNYGRPALLKNPNEQAFFISERGTRPDSQSLYIRLKQLVEKAEINKNVRLHDLRHSIATHLLQSGMKLNHIAKFLGHQSIESTQIYTHLVNEIEGNGNEEI